jgi:hypothetical protein
MSWHSTLTIYVGIPVAVKMPEPVCDWHGTPLMDIFWMFLHLTRHIGGFVHRTFRH